MDQRGVAGNTEVKTRRNRDRAPVRDDGSVSSKKTAVAEVKKEIDEEGGDNHGVADAMEEDKATDEELRRLAKKKASLQAELDMINQQK